MRDGQRGNLGSLSWSHWPFMQKCFIALMELYTNKWYCHIWLDKGTSNNEIELGPMAWGGLMNWSPPPKPFACWGTSRSPLSTAAPPWQLLERRTGSLLPGRSAPSSMRWPCWMGLARPRGCLDGGVDVPSHSESSWGGLSILSSNQQLRLHREYSQTLHSKPFVTKFDSELDFSFYNIFWSM